MTSTQRPSATRVRHRPIGQHESLTDRLQGLIRGYPKGIGILKEFIQNADDAGASQVEIVMDWRSHPTHGLPFAAMERLCGPALLVRNDATFTEQDFASILALGRSGKRLDSAKIGKFGLGFNAAYNVTDHPCLVSRDQLYILDPHHSVVPFDPRHPGAAFDLTPDLWDECAGLLAPFEAAGLAPGTQDADCTIFRLPVRTPTLAAESKISSEEFTADDFHELVAQITDRAADLLLFLKHVTSLRIVELPADGGSRLLLSISTENESEVHAARALVNDVLKGSPDDVVATLRRTRALPRPAPYRHRMRVEHAAETAVADWLVVNGLYADEGGELLGAAEAMLRGSERALPLAGAAIRLTHLSGGRVRPEPVTGYVYCGLPLPKPSGLGVHLNGFFELDSNREWLKSNPESTGLREKQRRNWNDQLLRHGVGSAIASALQATAALTSGTDADHTYSLWPPVDGATAVALPGLATSVYQRLWVDAARVIYVRSSKPGWVAPSASTVLPAMWHARLIDPLVAGGFLVAEPPPPAHVLLGFQTVGHPLAVLTPRQLRDRWRTTADVNMAPAHAPNLAWRRRDWITQLLTFVLSDGAPDLAGVPLALLCDGRLHTFGYSTGGETYIADDEQRAIFSQRLHWFLDPKLVEATRMTENGAAKVFRMDASIVLRNLSTFLEKDKASSKWNPRAKSPPHAEWLTRVFEYLSTTQALGAPANLLLFERLAIIPDQAGELHRPGTAQTPLWPPTDRRDGEAIAAALRALRVRLVGGSERLRKALRAAVSPAPRSLVGELTGPTLVDVLAATAGTWTERYSSTVHPRVLDLLSRDAENLDAVRLAALRALPLLPVRGNGIVCAADDDVFVPSDARLPLPPGSARLLQTGEGGAWRKLYSRLALPVLKRRDVLERILDADFRRLRPAVRSELLEWVRHHYDQIVEEYPTAQRGEVQRRLTEKVMIAGSDGALHSASTLYDPTVAVVREVLGDTAVFPDTARAYATDTDLWLGFFQRLGMETVPRARDIVRYVDGLVTMAEAHGTRSVTDRSLALLEYIREHWAALATQRLDDPSTSQAVTFAEALRTRAWLPAQRDPSRLGQYAGALVPEDRLYRPDELFESRVAHLVSSCAPLAPFQTLERTVRRGLGIPGEPPIALVLRHFDRLLALWARADHGGLTAELIGKSLKAIYRAIGNRLGGAADTEAELSDALDTDSPEAELTAADVHERYENVACLWDPGQERFWLPRHAFSVPVRFFGSRRVTLVVPDSQAQVGFGFDVLGRRSVADSEDVLDFLEDVALEYGESELSSADRTHVVAALSHFERRWADEVESADEGLPSRLLLPTRDRRLVSASSVYHDDAPYFSESLSPGAMHLCDPDVSYGIRYRLPSLAASLSERMFGQAYPATDGAILARCAHVQRTLRSPAFAAGLTRLVRHSHAASERPDLSWLRQLAIVPVEPFQAELVLQEDGRERVVGITETSAFLSPDERCVYVAADSVDMVASHLAQALNGTLGALHLSDLAPLAAILAVASPEDIGPRLTRMRIREVVRSDAEQTLDDAFDAGALAVAFPEDGDAEDEIPEVEPEEGSGEAHHWDDVADEPRSRNDPDDAPAHRRQGNEDESVDDGGERHDRPVANNAPEPRGTRGAGHDSPERGDVPTSGRPSRPGSVAEPGRREPVTTRDGEPDGWHVAADRTSVAHGGAPPGQPRPGPRHASARVPDPDRARVAPAAANGTGDHERRRAPGSGAERGAASGGAQRRVVTYLVAEDRGTIDDQGPELEADMETGELPRTHVLGREAEAFAAREETQLGREVTPMPPNNPGFDLLSTASEGGDERFIEVKGLAGAWGEAGVALSAQQFAKAQQEREAFWLYVVEFAGDAERQTLTRIQNPAEQVTQYRLDAGWRVLAAPSRNEPRPDAANHVHEDDIGRVMELEGGRRATILGVRRRGTFVQITLRNGDGTEVETLFRPGLMRVER